MEETFEIARKYGLKLNLRKYTFRFKGGRFLDYMVTGKGIEANPKKVRAMYRSAGHERPSKP